MINHEFQTRIQYQGDLQILLQEICRRYGLGDYIGSQVISVGYEDLNIVLTTGKGKHLVKAFADFRSLEDCQRYVEMMLQVIEAGVHHPKLYQAGEHHLEVLQLDGAEVRVCVLEYIDGHSFYDLDEQPTKEELGIIASQAAVINQLPLKPPFVYDSWAVVNILNEYEKKHQYLREADIEMVQQVVDAFSRIDLKSLPYAFVHGDIIKTNVMRDKDGKIYILDFSVANYYPRVQELAVLFCDLFFNEKDPSNFKQCYELGLEEYQRKIKLISYELEVLPVFVKAAHAMHIICPTFERDVNGNDSKENAKWLELGRIGLRFALQYWS